VIYCVAIEAFSLAHECTQYRSRSVLLCPFQGYASASMYERALFEPTVMGMWVCVHIVNGE